MAAVKKTPILKLGTADCLRSPTDFIEEERNHYLSTQQVEYGLIHRYIYPADSITGKKVLFAAPF